MAGWEAPFRIEEGGVADAARRATSSRAISTHVCWLWRHLNPAIYSERRRGGSPARPTRQLAAAAVDPAPDPGAAARPDGLDFERFRVDRAFRVDRIFRVEQVFRVERAFRVDWAFRVDRAFRVERTSRVDWASRVDRPSGIDRALLHGGGTASGAQSLLGCVLRRSVGIGIGIGRLLDAEDASLVR